VTNCAIAKLPPDTSSAGHSFAIERSPPYAPTT
jgi:hypothetical protein